MSTLTEKLLSRGQSEGITDWKIYKLKNVAKVERGRFSHRPRNDPRFFGGQHPFIQTADIVIGNGKIKSASQSINDEGLKISKMFPRGTLMMAIAANIGDCSILTFDSACTDSVVGITPDRELLNGNFLLYYLSTQKSVFKYVAPAGAQKNINVEFLDSLPLLIPPLPEQQKIAEILGACDKAIEAQERLIAQKQQRKKGLMQKLLTGEVRFPEFERTPEWKYISLNTVSTRLTEKVGKRALDVLSITAGYGYVAQKDKFSKVIAGRNYTNYVVLDNGDFSYNKGNSLRFPQGCIYRLDEYERGAVPNVFYSFRMNSEKTVSGFYVQLFKMGYQNKQLRAYINSGVRNDGLLNLTNKDFFKMELPVPSIKEQQVLSDFFASLDHEITLQQNKLEQLKQHKKGLMQLLLTGKVRVKI